MLNITLSLVIKFLSKYHVIYNNNTRAYQILYYYILYTNYERFLKSIKKIGFKIGFF